MANSRDTYGTRPRTMTKFAGAPNPATDYSRTPIPRPPGQVGTIPAMPRFQGPPARASLPSSALNSMQAAYQARALNYANAAQPVMGLVSGANRVNAALAGTGLDRYTNPIMGAVNNLTTKAYGALAGQTPELSYPNQLHKLVGEGWYTPQAQASMYSVPYRMNMPQTGGRAYYNANENSMNLPKGYFENMPFPEMPLEDLTHEFGHYFDVGPQGGRYSTNPAFLNAAKKTDAEFYPGMGVTPPGSVNQAAAPQEMYADVGRNPYWFRKLSQWYPQYTSTAYRMPAYAGGLSPRNQDRTWQFFPPAGRGPYTDIANRTPGKVITGPDLQQLYYSYQRDVPTAPPAPPTSGRPQTGGSPFG